MDATTTLIVLPILQGNVPAHLYGLQIFLAPYTPFIEAAWSAIFVASLATAAYIGFVKPLYRTLRAREIIHSKDDQ